MAFFDRPREHAQAIEITSVLQDGTRRLSGHE